MFNVGEKVVCINPIYNLIKDEIYTIQSIYNCECGHSMVILNNVFKIYEGIYSNQKIFTKNTLCNCGNSVPDGNLFGANRFRKLDYDFAENLLSEITEQANREHK
jgi:hypothetical protein